jgi:hypothetical protein
MRAIVKTWTGAPERLAIRAARSIADVGISRLSEARRTARTSSVSGSGSPAGEAHAAHRDDGRRHSEGTAPGGITV